MKKPVFFSIIVALSMLLTSCVGYYGARPGYYDRPYYRNRPNVYAPVYPQRSYRHHHGRRY